MTVQGALYIQGAVLCGLAFVGGMTGGIASDGSRFSRVARVGFVMAVAAVLVAAASFIAGAWIGVK